MNFSKLKIELNSLTESLQSYENKLKALGIDMGKAEEEERKLEEIQRMIS